MITISFAGLADAEQLRPSAGDDACEAEWFTLLDYTTKDENGGTVISYTLGGAETLRPVVRYPAGRMQQIEPVKTGGLAFDHAESIAYSYAYLKRRVHEGFLKLAFADADMREHARRVLGE